MADFAGHRPGTLKQQNKSHKSRHRTKSATNDGFKVEVARAVSSGKKAAGKREDRRNQASQTRANKRLTTMATKRKGVTAEDPPLLITLIPLSASVADCFALRCWLTSPTAPDDLSPDAQPYTFVSTKHKRRVTVLVADPGDVQATLQAAQVSDVLVFGVAAATDGAGLGKSTLESAILAQGVPTTCHVLLGLDAIAPKRRADVKKLLTKAAAAVFPDTRVFSVDSPADADAFLWGMTAMKLKPLLWREARPYLVAERVVVQPAGDGDGDGADRGTLCVSGYLRGAALDVNRLVCIPGVGAFQLQHVGGPPDPHPLHVGRVQATAMAHGEHVLARPHPLLQESLQSEQPIDPLAAEQTWPTADDYALAATEAGGAADGPVSFGGMVVPGSGVPLDAIVRRPPKVRVPKGTSAYQAAWIVEALREDSADDGEMDDTGDDGDGLRMDERDDHAEESSDSSDERSKRIDDLDDDDDDDAEEEYEEVDRDGNQEGESMSAMGGESASKYDAMMEADDDAMMQQLDAAQEDHAFPDEVDTPRDMAARLRFSKYRGLESFKHSPWNCKEDLPQDYARIFQFENFARTRKRVMSGAEPSFVQGEDGLAAEQWPVGAGTFVTLYISGVPLAALAQQLDAGSIFTVFGLLEHENKMSVLNFKLTMHAAATAPIRAKDTLIFWSGFRRFAARPQFSEPSTGEKHKMERFFQPNSMTMASVYAPITFAPMPVLVFRACPDGSMQLVATGALASVDPDRMVIKRIRLSGHPFKINRKLATIRFMFYTPEDINWFKSVEIVTKYGRRGHIKESLGTHGHMKCTFDGQLNAQDTVLMNLYKRVYPKWSYAEDGLRRRIVTAGLEAL